jgi:1-acyl-sn-glycerol-3-phosphate acyltransferase
MDEPKITAPVLTFFRRIVRGYFRRHFRAVRIANPQFLAQQTTGPLIVYANHSSWWDPMVSVLLAQRLLPQRQHFAPMDASALARYGILKRIGIFGVDLNSIRGAARFLRSSLNLLGKDAVLWITPQGRFADPRERPLAFKPGMAALAARCPNGCTLVPLAIEYPFWTERLPETLLLFGSPIHIAPHTPTEEADALLQAALLEAMHSLEQKSIARDPAAFELLYTGRVGTGGFYQFGQRLLARVTGRRYQPAHAPLTENLVAQKERG